jgi:hypothetical protein
MRSASLRGAGLVTAALLALTALFFHVPALASHKAASEVFRWLLATGLLGAFLWGYRALRDPPEASGRRRTIVGFAAAFCLLSLLVPPFHDIDLCCYINIGWQQAHYGLNPYTRTLSEVPGWQHDPMFRPYWLFTPSAYGFLFDLLARVVCQIGNGDWGLTLFLFRAFNVLVFALLGWVVWACCRRLRLPHPERVLYLLLWNPLLLMTGLVQGHNDILMALFSALAVYLALGRGWPLAMPALVAATLVKYLTGPLLPLAFLLLVRRHGWGKAVVSSALGLLLGAALSWPYLGDGPDFQVARSLANFTEMHNSLAAMLAFPFEVGGKLFPALAAHHAQATGAIKLAGWALFGTVYAGVALRWLRNRTRDGATLLRDCVLVHFVLVCLVSSKFYPWYMGMFLPLALLLPAGDWLRRAVLAISCALVLSLTFINQAHFLNVLVMLLLPLAAALWPRDPLRMPWRARLRVSVYAGLAAFLPTASRNVGLTASKRSASICSTPRATPTSDASTVPASAFSAA